MHYDVVRSDNAPIHHEVYFGACQKVLFDTMVLFTNIPRTDLHFPRPYNDWKQQSI